MGKFLGLPSSNVYGEHAKTVKNIWLNPMAAFCAGLTALVAIAAVAGWA